MQPLRSSDTSASSGVYTRDWTSPHIAQWNQYVKPLFQHKPCHLLEIGVFEARSAVWFLENILTHKESRYTGIDPYMYCSPSIRNEIPLDLQVCRDTAVEKLGAFAEKAELLITTDVIALSTFLVNEQQFDIVRVDGEHTAFSALSGIVAGWRLVRPGGVMLIDDFDNNGEVAARLGWGADCPKTAANAFLSCLPQVNWKELYRGYELAILKTASAH